MRRWDSGDKPKYLYFYTNILNTLENDYCGYKISTLVGVILDFGIYLNYYKSFIRIE